jgi:hypothetical protein
MNSKIKRAALKISLIQEEFTEKEISAAIKLIQGKSDPTTLLRYLNKEQFYSTKKKKQKRTTKPFEEQQSKAVMDLEDKDPEKFMILSKFDMLLRKGVVLKKLDDIKDFANRLSKDFPKVKARRDGISKLMGLLVVMPIDHIKINIEQAISESNSKLESSEYQELAQFIIHGDEGRL